MLWEHETKHAYSEQGLATRQEPDGLPPVEWLTYGSGYLAGMKLGGTPLVEYTRDRLHRETARSFGGEAYELATARNTSGQLRSRHLNLPQLDRDYDWNDNGQLIRISGPQESREYRYSDTGRLTGVHTTAANPTLISRMRRTRQETGCRTRNCTRTAPSRHGRITASRKMRTMSTATMNTAGWRRRRTVSRKG